MVKKDACFRPLMVKNNGYFRPSMVKMYDKLAEKVKDSRRVLQ